MTNVKLPPPRSKSLWAVTVKLPSRSDHDVYNKKTGHCPFSGMVCSDITGRHHTVVVRADNVAEAETHVMDRLISPLKLTATITRVEHVSLPRVGIEKVGSV